MPRRIASDNFEAYHDLYAKGSTVSRIGERFAATMTACQVGGLLVFDRQIAGVVHQRDASRVRSDTLEHVNVQVLRSGRMLAGSPGSESLLSPGDAVLFDTTLPQRTMLHDADYVTVALARDAVEAVLPDFRSLHGRVLPRDADPAFGQALLLLARGTTAFSDATLGGRHLITDLLAAVTGAANTVFAKQDEGKDEVEAARRLRAGLFIDAHLGRHDLDASMIAVGSGLSRSSLYRAFAPVGGVTSEIVRRRVARLRSAILRGTGNARILTLAWDLGFTSPSHCARSFKAAYGVTPRQLVNAMRQPRGRFESQLKPDQMRDWFMDLNQAASIS